MPDINDLDRFDEGLPVNPLPASEVRRRGDRMRRRNSVLATVGGVAAAAVFIGLPVAVVANQGGDDVQPAPPAPTSTSVAPGAWLDAIPDGFPLADGFPRTTGGTTTENDDPTRVELMKVCGTEGWPIPDALDAAAITYEGESEDRANRTLVVYADDDAATAALDEIRAPKECPAAETDPDFTREYDVVALDLGTEDSYVFTETVRHDDGAVSGLTVTEIARAGNALYFSSSYGSAGGEDVVEFETQRMLAASAAPLAAMCVFAAEPCDTPTTEPSAATSESTSPAVPSEALADFPLDMGYPEKNDSDGSPVEVTGKPGVGVIDLCDSIAWDPYGGTTDLIGVEYSGPEDWRGRTLVVYKSEDQAVEALSSAAAVLESCPEEVSDAESGASNVYEPFPVDLGDQAVGWTQRYRIPDGFPPALDVYHLVRVGDTVYASYESGEGGGSPENIANSIEHATDQARPIVEAMKDL